MPYGVVEMWNDRRRLGLPFFEIPANEGTLTGSDMEKYIQASEWKMVRNGIIIHNVCGIRQH